MTHTDRLFFASIVSFVLVLFLASILVFGLVQSSILFGVLLGLGAIEAGVVFGFAAVVRKFKN